MKQIIHIYGASGAGTSTIGKYICDQLGYRFMDSDDYCWMPTNPPFTTLREGGERVHLMREDIASSENVVIAGSLSGWGDVLIPEFTLVIRVITDEKIRMERIHAREYQRFGSRIEPGGDMYQTHKEFIEWAKKYDTGSVDMRSKANHDEWQKLLCCRQIRVDGSKSLQENFELIQQEIHFLEMLDQVKKQVRDLFEGDSSGHDYWHSIRVYSNASKLCNFYQADWNVVALAALLHDVDDRKLFDSKDYDNARKIMTDYKIDEQMQHSVINAIKTVSFKGKDTITPDTIEGKIVQDADRLDAIGAIGIARTFAFGGSRGRRMHEPGEEPRMNMSDEDYKNYHGTTLNHFYEKLFLLKDLMNTEAAKQMAEGREQYMQQFLNQIMLEWNGVR